MTDKTELEVTAADDGKEYVIRKGGYFYRPKAEGYTSNVNDAGRFSLKQAILHSFPNGPDGPRDGITYELATRTPDPTPAVPADGLVEALTEIERRTGLLIHQNTGRWSAKNEHDLRTMNVLSVNQSIARTALAAHRGEA